MLNSSYNRSGRDGVVTYFADRTVTIVQVLLLSPENLVPVCLSVCVVTFFTALLFELHVRMESALDALLAI